MNLVFSYQQQQLPPPFSYAAVMRLEFVAGAESINVEFDLTYLNRESVSESELKAEGFTNDDDLKWEGTISSRWQEDLSEISQSNFSNDPDSETYIHVSLDSKSLGFPADVAKANFLFQELLQAVLEKSNIEAPLNVVCYLDQMEYNLTWSFSDRTIDCNGTVSSDWVHCRKLLEHIYSLDFESFVPKKKKKENSISLESDVWFYLDDTNYAEELNSLIRHVVN
ncbi:hypothetical protein [Ekhidna sp.]